MGPDLGSVHSGSDSTTPLKRRPGRRMSVGTENRGGGRADQVYRGEGTWKDLRVTGGPQGVSEVRGG